MAWNEVLQETSFSVLLAPQNADINTAGTVWTGIDCEMPQVTYDAAQTETRRSRRSRGAATKRLTGKIWPRVAIRFPAVGQPKAYNYISDTPGLLGPNVLLDYLGGSANIAYQAAGINPLTGNTISLVTSTGKLGCLVAAREASGLVQALGIIKSLTGAGPYTATLFEDMGAMPGAAIPRLPTVTKYPGLSAVVPQTIRVTGEHANQEKLFLGWLPTSMRFAYDESDWRGYWTVEGIAYGGEQRGTSGGLQPVAKYLPLEPLVERGGGRFVIGSNVFATFNNATVDPDGTCDVRGFEFAIEFGHYPARKPRGKQGVKEVLLTNPSITASFSVPDISDFEVSGEQFQERAWRDLGETSITHFIGDAPGQILGMQIPRGIATAWPETAWVDGVRHRQISVEAGEYEDDGATTDAGNTVARLFLA